MSGSSVGCRGGIEEMRVSGGQLDAIYIPHEESDLRGVEESGWYIVNDDHRMVGGPFSSREDCVAAIGSANGRLGADGLAA